MSLNTLRTIIHQVLLEEAKKKDKKDKETKKPETKKSSGKLIDLKNELKSLKTMKESLAQYSVNEAVDTQSLTEFTHLQKFVTEIERIKEATGKLSVTLEEHINEVEGKIAEETQKIKEMMGLVSEKEVAERKMTKKEKGTKEKIVKGMKKSKGDLEKRYGKNEAEKVMYATATKKAMKK
jgi:TolA-binding protein